MPHKTRRSVAVILVLLVALAGLTANVAPAAAASCTGNGCNGRDPHKAACDAKATTETVAEFTSEDIRVELRHSHPCVAAWARATVAGPPGMPRYSYVVLKAYHSQSGGTPFVEYWVRITDSTNNKPPTGTVIWTSMHSFTVWVQACLLNSHNQGSCTGRH